MLVVEYVVGFLGWVVANVVYADFRRRGTRGFWRFIAFWMGSPTTFATLLLVPENVVEPVLESDEGLDELIGEIREDRREREAGRLAAGGDEG